MARTLALLAAFNRGLVSPLAIARVDLDRLRLSAETMTNWIPRTIGAMRIKPGLGYIAATRGNAQMVPVDFVFASDDTAIIELTNGKMRVRVDDELVERPSVSSTVTNGDMGSATGWTLATTGSATCAISGGVLTMAGISTGGRATAQSTITVAAADQNVRHAIRIVVTRGPVTFKIGTAAGLDDLLDEQSLMTGTHSLAFTPTGASAVIHFETTAAVQRIVDSATIEAAGTMEIDTPWATSDLRRLQWEQSADVIFVGSEYQQRRIERRAVDSWSIVLFQPNDGPFSIGKTAEIRLTPAATRGNTTLTADRAFFKSSNVGSLFRLFHTGQVVQASLSAEDTYSNTIRVTGVTTTNSRRFNYAISGTWEGTLHLQRSFTSELSGFEDVQSFTANQTADFQDTFENAIVWYRIGFKTGNYTSGTAGITLTYSGGGGYGKCRVTGYTSSTVVDIEVLDDFHNTTATDDWNEGQWSDRRGWPTAPVIFDGRLWWFGNDRIWGSVSDAYESHNADFEGDAGPINRTIGSGPIANIRWAVGAQRLLLGSDGAEHSIRSSNFDAPVTPTDFAIRECSTQGSAPVVAVRVDSRIIYVQKSGIRVYELAFDYETQDYKSRDLTEIYPDIGAPGIVKMIVQRQPDTRIHCIRSDGKVACLLYEPSSETLAWYLIETSGAVEDGVVLPGADEDQVYYVVRRTIGTGTVRYLEKFAQESECVGGTVTKLADSFIYRSMSSSVTVTGLGHLEGKSVVVWGDGRYLGTYTVSAGQITLTEPAGELVIGLGYDATFKSTKLAYGARQGTAVNQLKRLVMQGLVLADTHTGLQVGQDADHLTSIYEIEKGGEAVGDAFNENYIWAAYDQKMFAVDGKWDTDARLVIKASAPKPATILAAVVQVSTHEAT